MSDDRTTAVIERYLVELAEDAPTDPVVRALLDRAVGRLRILCASLLYRGFPRLTRPPLNLQTDELLDAVVERLLKAMREVRPQTVRQFFAMANRHMRWELNDLARRLDGEPDAVELNEGLVPAAQSSGSPLSPTADASSKPSKISRKTNARSSAWSASRACHKPRPPRSWTSRPRRCSGD